MSKIAMQEMANRVKSMLPEDFGFAIIVFPFNDLGISNYISNANRSDMIKTLRETADRIEKNQTFETPENNIY